MLGVQGQLVDEHLARQIAQILAHPAPVELPGFSGVLRVKRRETLPCGPVLEAIASGITIFEDEFLASTVLGTDKTIAELVSPQLAAIASGQSLTSLSTGKIIVLFGAARPQEHGRVENSAKDSRT